LKIGMTHRQLQQKTCSVTQPTKGGDTSPRF
jgi:hypothetical protein